MKTGLLTMTDDLLIHIASMLTAPTDLVRLQLTCPRFSAKVCGSSEMLSIPEEAARLWLEGCSQQERGWVPRRGLESWLGLMHEVGLLWLPLAFGWSHPTITLSEDGALATKGAGDGMFRSAANRVVMRSGRHSAQFTVVAGRNMFFGVVRPWGVPGVAVANIMKGHCFYYTAGTRHPGTHAWEGMQDAKGQGDRIGMLLDLDQGSMSVWKNGELLGVMQADGLSGPLCWAVELYQGSARIESAPAPPSPTEEELAAAKAWQRRTRLGLLLTATDAECAAASQGREGNYRHEWDA